MNEAQEKTRGFKKYFNLGKVGEPKWAKLTDQKELAVAYCVSELQFYEDWGRHNRIHWKIWQNIAITSGVLATIVAALPNNFGVGEVLAGIIRVVPTALTAVSATVLGVYNYKGEHIRQGLTHDALQGELAKFLSSANPYDDASGPKNTALFVCNIRKIVGGELAAWRGQFQSEDRSSSSPKPDTSSPDSAPHA